MTKKSIMQIMGALVIIVLALYFIAGTYARYTGSGYGYGTVEVAKWKISVGGIGNGGTDMAVKFNQIPNKHVVDGKIAPDTELYADVLIDPTGTEVSIDYSFEIGEITNIKGGTAVPKDMHVTKVCYIVPDGTEGATVDHDGQYVKPLNYDTNEKVYKGSILLPANADKEGGEAKNAFAKEDAVKVRIYAQWDNNELNNANDSEIARTSNESPLYQVQIKATCKQHIASDD